MYLLVLQQIATVLLYKFDLYCVTLEEKPEPHCTVSLLERSGKAVGKLLPPTKDQKWVPSLQKSIYEG